MENTFTSTTDMADAIIPIVKKFEKHVVTEPWNTKEIVKDIECPILFISSEKDEMIPVEIDFKLHFLNNQM